MRTGKRHIQKREEIKRECLKGKMEKKETRGQGIYKKQADAHRDEKLSELVKHTITDLACLGDEQRLVKLDLYKTDIIKKKTLQYLQVCSECSTIPSLTGLAHALGYTSSGISKAMSNKSAAPEVIEWIEFCKEEFTNLINQAGLTNQINTVYGIFYSKAVCGQSDGTSDVNVNVSMGILPEVPSVDEIEESLPEYSVE